MLTYTRPLLTNGVSVDNSAVQIYFEEAVLETFMPTLSKGDIQCITDQKGNILYFRGDGDVLWDEKSIISMVRKSVLDTEKTNTDVENVASETFVKIGRDKYFVIWYNSGQSELTYYTMQPEISANQRKTSNIIMLSICIAIAIAVGMLLSYYMSKKTATPINDILKETSWSMERFKGHQSVFSSLKTTFHYLVKTNSKLAEAMENQKPYIRNVFINRLIFESFMTRAEAEKIASWMNLEYKDRIFCVVIFQICLAKDDLDQTDMTLLNSCILSLQEEIDHILPESLYTSIGDNQVVLLLNMSEEDEERFREIAEQKLCIVKEEIPFSVAEKIFIYGGNLVKRLSDVHESYSNASYMFRNEKGQT